MSIISCLKDHSVAGGLTIARYTANVYSASTESFRIDNMKASRPQDCFFSLSDGCAVPLSRSVRAENMVRLSQANSILQRHCISVVQRALNAVHAFDVVSELWRDFILATFQIVKTLVAKSASTAKAGSETSLMHIDVSSR